MKFHVNNKSYDCIISAWTPIRYYLRYRQSFLSEWNKNNDNTEREHLLKKLFYIAINRNDLLFSEFQKEAEADERFFSTAFTLFLIIFANSNKPRNGHDYGIEYNELTFLAMFGKSGLPEKVLDELTYFDIMEVFSIQGDLSNPDTYEYRMASDEERKMALGISKQAEEELEKFLLGGVNDGCRI